MGYRLSDLKCDQAIFESLHHRSGEGGEVTKPMETGFGEDKGDWFIGK